MKEQSHQTKTIYDSPFNREFSTDAIHAGESKNMSATPIYQAATVDGQYLRSGNPTIDAFEIRVKTLARGAWGTATASGTSAISQVLTNLLEAGSRIVCHHTVYVWTKEILNTYLSKFGVEVVYVDMTDLDQLREAVKTKTKVVYFEPFANPTLDVIDVKSAIEIGKASGGIVVVDNTFLTPYLLRPLDMGADIVLHSATKYLCGHGDTLAGIIVSKTEEMGHQMDHIRNAYGGILSPQNAFLLLRGIKTLPVRMQLHCSNAQSIAEFLESHPKIKQVTYPGLSSSRGHEIAKMMTNGFGGMINFETIDNDIYHRFLKNVKLCKPWVSLGDAQSLVIGQGGHNRIRMSVGLEAVSDIIYDLDQALA